VRGRVDAVYDAEDPPAGGLEIVDFKTGRRPAPDDAGAGFQLGLYALAAVECWGPPAGGIRTTEWYVREGAGVARDWDTAGVEAVRDRLAELLGGVAAGRFEPVPGSYCRRCAHVAACPEGQTATAGER
jgi:RecB family exonuclease